MGVSGLLLRADPFACTMGSAGCLAEHPCGGQLDCPVLMAYDDLGAESGQAGCKIVDFRSFHPFSDVGTQHIINELYLKDMYLQLATCHQGHDFSSIIISNIFTSRKILTFESTSSWFERFELRGITWERQSIWNCSLCCFSIGGWVDTIHHVRPWQNSSSPGTRKG